MTGILDSLINVKLSLEGGIQSTYDNYVGIISVSTPGRSSFKVMCPLDARPEDGFPFVQNCLSNVIAKFTSG